MNFGELKDFAASLLDDLEFGYFTESQVGVWINMGQRKLQRKLIEAGQGHYLKCASATLVINDCSLPLPDDFHSIHKVKIITGGTYPNENSYIIQPVTLNESDLLDSLPAAPMAYYLQANKLKIVPIPDNNYSTQVTYCYSVVDMTNDNQEPDAPEQYHELIGIYGAKYGYVKDDRSMVQIEKMEQEYIADLKRDAQQRQKQMSRWVRATGYNDTGNGEMF